MAKKNERKILKSISFTESQLNLSEKLIQEIGGSFAELVRTALDEYLAKSGLKVA